MVTWLCSAPGQVCHDHHRALEHADQEHVTARIIRIDLRSEFGHPALNLLFGVEDVLEVRFDVA